MRAGPPPVHPSPGRLPGLEPAWSRTLTVTDASGERHRWHLLDNGVHDPVGTLLCVHGNPTWSYLWRRLLADAPHGWRVVAPDQLGMGYSERTGRPRVLAERVADLGDLTDALAITGPVVTVGHDWGGAVSVGWALEHRTQLRGMVLANTAVAQPPGDRGPLLIRLAHVPAVRSAACVRTPAFVHATAALSRPVLDRGVRRALAAPYDRAARRQAIGDFVADIPFAHHHRHPSRATLDAIASGLRTVDVPALLLWGPRDPVFGERYLADLRSRLPQAALHRFEGASHLVTEDRPGYAKAVAQWVADLETSDPPGTGRTTSASARPTAGGSRVWSALADRSDDPAPAVVEVDGPQVSWAELDRRVGELAAGMAAHGVRPGHRVAMLVEPSVDLTAAVYAAWRAGAVVVVADKGLGFVGMRRALRSASVDHVVGGLPGLAAARLMGLPGTRLAVGAPGATARRLVGAHHTLDELTDRGRGARLPAEPSPDEDCAVVFTSGATGPAKGVVYRHRQVEAVVDLLRRTYHLGSGDRVVAAFAPFALFGPALGVGTAVPDIDVTAPGTLTAAALSRAVAAVDATAVFASPAALRNVAATAEARSDGQSDAQPDALTDAQRSHLAGVRLLLSAGAPVPASLLVRLRTVLPSAEAHTPYGMTEALPVTDVRLSEIEQAGPGDGVCVGRPLPGVDVALSPLSDLGEADRPLTTDPGCTGEICVRAEHVKDRYDHLWATERASSRNPGWHRTGDVGHLDEGGLLWVEGRLAHVVTTAAGVVTPVALEQQVEALDAVRAAAVVGVGPPGTQVVVVVVVPEPPPAGTALRPAPADTSDAVRAAVRPDVAAVLLTGSLPLDIRHASKVDRGQVARRAARTLAGGRHR